MNSKLRRAAILGILTLCFSSVAGCGSSSGFRFGAPPGISSSGVVFVPQYLQNLASSGSSLPQFIQNITSLPTNVFSAMH